jgi:hypothetical protein
MPRFDQPIEPMTLGNVRPPSQLSEAELSPGAFSPHRNRAGLRDVSRWKTGTATEPVSDWPLGGAERPRGGRQGARRRNAVAYVAVQCYYLDMGWRNIAYALVMAGVAAAALTTIIDLGRHTVALWH